MQPFPGQPGPNDRALTGLRGLAALMVVAHHYLLLGLPHEPLWPGLENGLYLAVDLFFVLSGYVMCLAYASWFPRGLTLAVLPAYAEFVLRRLARLWPLHAAVTAAVLLATYVQTGWLPWPKLVATNFLLVQGWGIGQSINAPAWSISTELAAYLLFPVLVLAAVHGPAVRAWLMAGLACALLLAAVTLAPELPGARRGALDIHMNWSVLPLLRCLGGFIVGLLLFRTLRHPAVRRAASHPLAAPAALAAFIAGTGFQVPDLLLYPVLPALVGATHYATGAYGRQAGRSIPYGLGVVSYPLYLVHYPILSALPAGGTARGFGFVFAVLLCIAAAYAAHRLVERPGQRAILRLSPALPSLAALRRPPLQP